MHEGVQQPLVKVVVNPPTIDTLGEEGLEGAPGNLVGGEVGATLCKGGWRRLIIVTDPSGINLQQKSNN